MELRQAGLEIGGLGIGGKGITKPSIPKAPTSLAKPP